MPSWHTLRGIWNYSLRYLVCESIPFVDVVVTAFVLMSRIPVPPLAWIPPFDKYSEYNPPGNYDGEFEYVFFLFLARGLLTGASVKTFRSKDCGGYLA